MARCGAEPYEYAVSQMNRTPRITTIIAISTLSACGLFRDHKAEERDQHARQVKSQTSLYQADDGSRWEELSSVLSYSSQTIEGDEAYRRSVLAPLHQAASDDYSRAHARALADGQPALAEQISEQQFTMQSQYEWFAPLVDFGPRFREDAAALAAAPPAPGLPSCVASDQPLPPPDAPRPATIWHVSKTGTVHVRCYFGAPLGQMVGGAAAWSIVGRFDLRGVAAGTGDDRLRTSHGDVQPDLSGAMDGNHVDYDLDLSQHTAEATGGGYVTLGAAVIVTAIGMEPVETTASVRVSFD